MRERREELKSNPPHMHPTWLLFSSLLLVFLSLPILCSSPRRADCSVNSMKREAATPAVKRTPPPAAAARKIPPAAKRSVLGAAAPAAKKIPPAAKRSAIGAPAAAEPKAPPARPQRIENPSTDLQRNLEEREKLVKELQSEVCSLNAELERLRILNSELQQEKTQLAKDLSETRLKVKEYQENVQRESERKATPPPPPPPPPPRSGKAKRAPSVVELFKSLPKHNGGDARVSIVGELQNRSAHQLAIKSDVEKKGSFVLFLIERIRSVDFENMDQVVAFVEWLDLQLSTLADERAVLKHFEWPEKKADAMREAAVEYRDLKRLEEELNCFRDHPSLPSEVAFKKITLLFDKLERRLERIIRLREIASTSYRAMKIPTDWMLDSGEIMSKLKLAASTKLAYAFLRRAQLDSAQETLLQGLAFAFRVYQVVGGLDRRTIEAFEELQRRAGARPPPSDGHLTPQL